MVFLWGREIDIKNKECGNKLTVKKTHFIIFRDNDQHFQVDIYIPEECKIDQINDRNDLLSPSRTASDCRCINSGT